MEGLIISPYRVMQSAAGYYIGRHCTDPGDGHKEPYDRVSGYFLTEDAAKACLESIEGR
jgi:hypothetical protein